MIRSAYVLISQIDHLMKIHFGSDGEFECSYSCKLSSELRHLCFSLLCAQGGSGGPAHPAGSSSAGRCRETIRSGGSLGQDEGPAAAHNRSHSALQVHTPVLCHPQVILYCLLFANFSTCSALLKEMRMAVELFLKTHDVNILRATRINFKLS